MSLRVHFLNGGSCRHLLASVDGRSFRKVTFHAVFLALQHPRLGWIVCDTGYALNFFAATRGWPYRLYRWATPVKLKSSVADSLAPLGVSPNDVEHVVVTHFHADHVGGLSEFPRATIHHHEEALAPLLALTPFRQTRAAFLSNLLPADLATRTRSIPGRAFATTTGLPFAKYDLFGDGSLRLVHLPGHAPGQVGLEFELGGREVLYCADAFWRWEQIEKGVNLPRPVLGLQWDGAAYRHTIEQLRAVSRAGSHELIACHDEKTQRYVTA